MHQVRKHLTYANVMSSIAVFLVLGGATAFAATHLGKNSVGTKQLKNNAVTSAKIKKEAVTGVKIKKNTISGSNIDLGSLGTVPSANQAATAGHAGTADQAKSADHASSADEAARANGQMPLKIFKTLLPGENGVTVATFAGFTISAGCDPLGAAHATLTAPSGAAAVMMVQGNGDGDPFREYSGSAPGETASIKLTGSSKVGVGSFTAALSNGTAAAGDIGFDYDTFGGQAPERCIVYGQVTFG